MHRQSEQARRDKNRDYPEGDDDYYRGRQRAANRQKSSGDERKQKKKHKKHKSRSRSHKKKKNKDIEHSRDKRNDMSEDEGRQNRGRNEKKKKKKHSRSPSNNRKKQKKRRSSDRKEEEKKSEDFEKGKQKYHQQQKSKDRSKDKKSKDRKSKQRKQKKKKQRYRSKERSISNDKYVDNEYPKDRYRYRSRSHEKKKDRRDDRRNDNRQDYYYRKDDRKRRDFRRKDNFRFDSPPKSDESDMSDDPQKMQQLAQLKAAKQLVSSKADRKLYLGNLPPNITSQQLMDMLNSALKKMEINTQAEGDSIVSAWISPDGVGHYAFVEFRSAQEATNGLALNGASLFGYQLKLGRPKQYIEYNKALLSEMGTDRNMDTILKKVAAFGKQQLDPVPQRIVCPPSRIVVLKHIVSIEELGIDEEYQQILDDVTDMAKRFGQVIQVFIPRPHQIIDLEHAPKRVKGLGLIFIEYKTVVDAKSARKKFTMKQFSGHPVSCCYFDEKRYRQEQFDIQERVIIDC